ncbi:O-antigen ligase family protein [Curtobacterium flaccumfaciens]|uniref:O-antigen ligase family protein n=1 Tax=Curtobacterium flaccumfaciens TaxID=2035 RepID=UPI0021C8CA1D|nr:O-antigen ligase family protein [Curtobacterium flaccumfaciens]UXN25367.1 O-antigen ligase family protein [Curtobacterium flaccumfaciens]
MTNTWPLARGTVPEREAFAFGATTLFVLFAGDAVPNTLTWVGAGVLWALVAAWGITILVRAKPPLVRTPWALWAFLGWCLVTLVWSHWRFATISSLTVQVICAAVAFTIASTLTWRRITDALSLALRWVLVLSLLFEAAVAVFVRHPIAPIWTDYGDRDVPDAFYFSRAELFTGGRIQGLPGNANLLAMVALLVAIVVAVQFAEGRIRRNQAIGWLVVAALGFVLTRSSTVIAAALVVAVVALAAVWMRRVPTERRTPRYLLLAVGAVIVAVAAFVLRGPVSELLGKGSDATGRGEIWAKVLGLIDQHPVGGGAGSGTGGRASRPSPTWRSARASPTCRHTTPTWTSGCRPASSAWCSSRSTWSRRCPARGPARPASGTTQRCVRGRSTRCRSCRSWSSSPCSCSPSPSPACSTRGTGCSSPCSPSRRASC